MRGKESMDTLRAIGLALALTLTGCAAGTLRYHEVQEGQVVLTRKLTYFTMGSLEDKETKIKPWFTLPDSLFSLNFGPRVN